MRLFVSLAALLLATGCASWFGGKSNDTRAGMAEGGVTNAPVNGGNGKEKLIITPQATLVGKVVRVNETARFAVLSFPVGNMPPAMQIMNVYRHGLKVGEVRVTSLRQDSNTVADIIKGDAEIGD